MLHLCGINSVLEGWLGKDRAHLGHSFAMQSIFSVYALLPRLNRVETLLQNRTPYLVRQLNLMVLSAEWLIRALGFGFSSLTYKVC